MNFISSREFNDADKVVKDKIYEWWNKNIFIGDLFESNITYSTYFVTGEEDQSTEAILGNTTPLLTVGQLIDIIEDKTGFYLDITYDETNDFGYIFNLGEYRHMSRYCVLLKALWELTQRVLSED